LPARDLTKKTAEQVCTFFEELRLPFVWPIFPDAELTCQQTLEAEGLFSRGELVAMAYAKPPLEETENTVETSLIFEKIKSEEGAAVWAQTAWQAFDSPPGAPVSFVDLARGLSQKENFLLLLARRERVPVGTAMLSLSGASMGVYYFATLPEERRKGVARAVMEEIFRYAWGPGSEDGLCDTITLQATPAGAPFYASLGFETLFKISLFSRSEEVF
jgi:GNAT superfamily N-acetyltransferase